MTVVGITLFAGVLLLAFIFGMTNGFMDGAGLVSTVITTRVLNPLPALILVAFCEIMGLVFFGQAVAHFLAHHIVVLPNSVPSFQLLVALLSALLGALAWNTSMWFWALPSSSSHALVGGLVGAFLAEFGSRGIYWGMFGRVFLFLVVVPFLGIFLGFLLARLIYWVGEFLTPAVNKIFRWLEILSLAGLALVHGSNDGQKSMGLVLLALLAIRGTAGAPVVLPWYVNVICGGALALGMFLGSRRMIDTLGQRLYKVQALQGFCAESSAMVLVGASSLLGFPMSTTHVMSTSILGVGVAVHPRGVRWHLMADIALVWLVTIPASGAVAAVIDWTFRMASHVVS